ncbi:NAD(P)-dependent oxidoreductase [Gammaproteobacteria bacterium]|nr:NAD(P)-dependent oxidoreductase [Gammaproteobacteria bacterium]
MLKSKKKYLFVGLGTMGYPMAGHLSKNQDFDIYVYNRTEAVSDKWLSEYKGLKFNLTDSNNIHFNGLITCLKNDEAIVDLLLKKRLISCLNKNSFVLDHSTTSLNLIELITSDECVIKNNISFFDAPVSGGEAGAINGVLSVMFGGPKIKVLTIKKIMNAYSKSIVHIGPSGHGQLTKMVNQICIAGLIQALSEGISLGKSVNLNMKKVFKAISNGAAQSWQMDNRFETMINEKFDFGFAVDLMIKDLNIALKESKDNNLTLKISNQVLKQYKKLSKLGDGDLDTSSLIKVIKS